MDSGTLKQILIEEMKKYAGEGLNAYSYLTENEAENLYTVVDIPPCAENALSVQY